MTQRLNDNIMCLLNKIENLEKRISDLSQSDRSVMEAMPDHSYSELAKTANAGGIEATFIRAVLSDDKRGITSEVQLKNLNNSTVSAIFVRVQSAFNIPGINNGGSPSADGMTNCNVSASSCVSIKEENWTAIEPDQIASLQISNRINKTISADIFSMQFTLLISNGQSKRARSFSFRNISIQ